jgi:hypothetical protein
MAACLERLEDPAVFFEPDPVVIDASRKLLQQCHDLLVRDVAQTSASMPASQLYVEGFDAEQIWAQIDMQMAVHMKRVRCAIMKISS